MRIMLLRAYPRHTGYTGYVTNLFVQGLTAGGAQIDEADLCASTMHHCTGCYRCWLATPGVCIHRDDVPALLERLLLADTVVCATPLYHYSMSSHLKVFMERTLPLTREGFEITGRGLMRNRTRYPDRWKDKRLAYISAGAFKGLENFAGLNESFRLLADGMNMAFAGGLARPESYLLRFALAKPRTIKIVETAIVRAGRELAAEGAMSQKTLEEAGTPLAPDMDHFRTYSNIFWEHAVSLGATGMDLDRILELVVGDVRVLMREMARSIDAAATARARFSLQFDFTDKGLHFLISVDHGTCLLEEKQAQNPDLRVTTTTSVWSGVFTRTLNVRDALLDGRITLHGDKFIFSRLDRYFPPPVV